MARFIRKQYIIKKDMQYRLMLKILIFMLFVAILVSWTVYLGVYKTLIVDLSGEKITLINKMISFRMMLWFLPSVLAIIISSVFLTHKIVGPIFVFQRAIKRMSQGESVEKVWLRRHDYFKDFADDLNDLINKRST